jgi:hypothetical protein
MVAMGIGVQALELMKYLHDDGHLNGFSSVIELGSQQFAPDLPAARKAIRQMFPLLNADSILVPKDFYRELNLPNYACIDLDGANDALVFDLNKSLAKTYNFEEKFDLVTNHGTTEHAFDQLSCFENVHNLTKQNGLMIHALPSQGYQNHSFFNYHPSFFLDLSAANGYRMLALYYNIGESLFPYTDSFLEKQQVSATEQVAVFAVLRKRTDKAFVVPFDGRYYFEQDGQEFVPRADVGGHARVEINEFPISEKYSSLPALEREVDSRPITKIVMPVWGMNFTSIFLNFALRSQIESGLLEFDSRENIEYIIVTDAAGAAMISASKFISALNNVCKVRIVRADHLAGQASYDRLTASYNLALSKAVPDDLYIFITADCFFSREVFKKIKEKSEKYRVVLSPALRVVEETFFSEVALSGLYNVDGREALAIAMRNEHPLTSSFCINNARDLTHPLPAQTLCRLADGYVGRWNVMHPIAIRIANPHQPILQTIDWDYALYHIKGWQDVGILDSIDDGLTVSLTPFNYSQDESYQRGGGRRARLKNLKAWANRSWALDYHMAQVSHRIRLLANDDPNNAAAAAAESQVAAIVDPFLEYVVSRKFGSTTGFTGLSAVDLFRPAVDLRQRFRLLPQYIRRVLSGVKRIMSRGLRKAMRTVERSG